MEEAYLVFAAWTGVALYRVNRPREAIQWLPLVLFSALWPLWWLFVIAGAIKRA